jgi:hypothetical protein
MKQLKSINNYIIEKLRINKNTKFRKINYEPEDRNELLEIVQKLIEERGDEADLNDIDTSKITDMDYLFAKINTSNFNGDISEWDVSNVNTMNAMFAYSKFTGKNGDISNWKTKNVISMQDMFAYSQFDGDISNWDVSNVENMQGMFCYSQFSGKKDDISNWDVSKVNNMREMFLKSNYDGDISKWDVSNVKDMHLIFNESKFSGNIDNWKVNDKAISTITFGTFKDSPLEKNPPKWFPYKDYKDPGYSFFDKVNEKEVEKLLSKNKLGLSINDVDERNKYNKKGKAFLFWKCWVVTAVYGPLTKENVLKKINEIEKCPPGGPYYLETTSYGTAFTKWNKEERFTSKGVRVGIIPNKQKDWKKYK